MNTLRGIDAKALELWKVVTPPTHLSLQFRTDATTSQLPNPTPEDDIFKTLGELGEIDNGVEIADAVQLEPKKQLSYYVPVNPMPLRIHVAPLLVSTDLDLHIMSLISWNFH